MTTSVAFSAPFLPALGAVVTLAVDYADLHPDSYLNNPAYTGYDALLAGDQIPYRPTMEPSGNSCSLSNDGLLSIVGEFTGDQDFEYAIVTQADGYQIGTNAIETVSAPLPDIVADPLLGEILSEGSIPSAYAFDSNIIVLPLVGEGVATGEIPQAHIMEAASAAFSGTLINWETNLPYANQTGLKMIIRATFNGPAIGSQQTFSTNADGDFSVPYAGAMNGSEYFVALANSDESITELHKLVAVV